MTVFRVRRLFRLGTGISIDHEASGYNRSRSRIQAIRICNPNCPADGLAAGGKFRRNACRLRNLQRWLQIPIIPIYHSAPIQPNWPSRVRLPLQLRHRPGSSRSGRRVRFRGGDGRFRFVRGAGCRPTRRGARMRYVPGVRAQSRGAGGDMRDYSGIGTRATDTHCLSATSPQTPLSRSFAQGRTPGTVRLARASTRGRRGRTD